VLTLSRDYFSLRKTLERRIYELARKHCGRQRVWRVSVEVLLKKSGSTSPRRVFRAMMREMIKADKLPDYQLTELPGDIIEVTARDKDSQVIERGLAPDTLEQGRSLMPGADIYALEAAWRAGLIRMPANPDQAFLAWVATAPDI
jgi:plasmid replication initiation protein